MRLVIADTGPINYLIQIGHIGVLPQLFERVALPGAVRIELSDVRAPSPVQLWIAAPPPWLEIHPVASALGESELDQGEREAIALAELLHADLLLMDDREGVGAARQRGLRVTGTLGLLDLAAERGLIDFATAIDALKHTTFRRPDSLLETLLEKYAQRKKRNDQ